MAYDDRETLEGITAEARRLLEIKQLARGIYAEETRVLELLLPEYLRQFAPYIQRDASLFRDFSLDSLLRLKREGGQRASAFMSSAPPDAIQAIQGHYRDVQLAVYKLCLIQDSPEVVLMHASNAGNDELALWAGALLVLEDRAGFKSEGDAIVYAANVNVAAAAAGNKAFTELGAREGELTGRLLDLKKRYAERPF